MDVRYPPNTLQSFSECFTFWNMHRWIELDPIWNRTHLGFLFIFGIAKNQPGVLKCAEPGPGPEGLFK